MPDSSTNAASIPNPGSIIRHDDYNSLCCKIRHLQDYIPNINYSRANKGMILVPLK
jgi:hypothetical protein